MADDHDPNVFLRPLDPGDYGWLRHAELSIGPRWRLGAAQPFPKTYAATLWEGVHSHHLAIDRTRSKPLGIVTIYNYDSVNGYAYLAAARFGHGWSDVSRFMRAFCRVVVNAFDQLPLRKLYLETPEYNMKSIRSFVNRGLMQIEGVMLKHRFFEGEYCDQAIVTIYPQARAQFQILAAGNGLR